MLNPSAENTLILSALDSPVTEGRLDQWKAVFQVSTFGV